MAKDNILDAMSIADGSHRNGSFNEWLEHDTIITITIMKTAVKSPMINSTNITLKVKYYRSHLKPLRHLKNSQSKSFWPFNCNKKERRLHRLVNYFIYQCYNSQMQNFLPLKQGNL